MTAFDPVSAGFFRLLDFQFPGNIDVYEYHNHAAVNGRADVLRINIYLSRDGSYVTIWNGLIEPALAEVRFDLPGDLCFKDCQRRSESAAVGSRDRAWNARQTRHSVADPDAGGELKLPST